MTLLSSMTQGPQKRPIRLLVHGVAGVGKSTFASGAPDPLFFDVENRTGHLAVKRVRPKTWQELISGLGEVYQATKAGKPPCKTVVIDTVDHAEVLLMAHLRDKYEVDSVEDIGGGFGKWTTMAIESGWKPLLAGLEALEDLGLHVVLVAHSEVKPFQNPEGPAYDQWVLKVNKKAAGYIRERVDLVGFARFEDSAVKEKGALKAKGISTGERVLCFGHSAAFESKMGIPVEETVPLSWEDFAKELK